MVLRNLKEVIIRTAMKAGEGHIASALSILDIVWILYNDILKFRADDPKWPDRDRFVLSKGHGCLALYAVLAEKGFFPKEWLDTMGKYDSPLGGHPDRNKIPGVEASTGSLGHGLPMAVGMALALKIKKSNGRVFCLVGDGECNEGTIWESLLLASHHKLGNLTVIVDYNHSTDRAIDLNSLYAKFAAFNFGYYHIDGHENFRIDFLSASCCYQEDRPAAFIVHTTKGNGCKIMERNPEWHHKVPTEIELEEILKDLQ